MKPHVADWSTKVRCARIVAQDGTTVRITEHPVDLVMSNGQVYRCDTGYEFTGYDDQSDMSPGSFDLTGILDHGITRDQLGSGVFDNARFYIFATSWISPVEDEEPVGVLTFGKTTLQDSTYKTEMMGLSDALNQDVSVSTTAQCQNTLFDRTLDGRIIATDRSRCTGPRANPDGPSFSAYKVSGTVTGVTSQFQFQDSVRPEAAEWFSSGQVRFLTGANAGLKPLQVKQSLSGGQIICYEAFYYPVAIGDQYEMIPGCRKRFNEDCVAKYNNGINFRGQPHMPTSSQSSAVGRGA